MTTNNPNVVSPFPSDETFEIILALAIKYHKEQEYYDAMKAFASTFDQEPLKKFLTDMTTIVKLDTPIPPKLFEQEDIEEAVSKFTL